MVSRHTTIVTITTYMVLCRRPKLIGPHHTNPDLSQGQRQIFSLARSLLRDGRIVIMDEVTSRYVFPLQARSIGKIHLVIGISPRILPFV